MKALTSIILNPHGIKMMLSIICRWVSSQEETEIYGNFFVMYKLDLRISQHWERINMVFFFG